MLSLIWVLEPILLGCLLVCRFTDLPAVRPMWARLWLIFGAGAAGGIGLASSLYFLVGVLLRMPVAHRAGTRGPWRGPDTKLSAARFRSLNQPGEPALQCPFPIAAGSLLLALGMATAAMWDRPLASKSPTPGGWDASSIWDLRARFLASDAGLAERAWSPVIGATTHAEYPLLVSSFAGRCWAYGHSLATTAPAATSYVFFLASDWLAAGGVAAFRGPTLGILMALALVATPASGRDDVPAQYVDVPLPATLRAPWYLCCWTAPCWPAPLPDSRRGPRTRVCCFWSCFWLPPPIQAPCRSGGDRRRATRRSHGDLL